MFKPDDPGLLLDQVRFLPFFCIILERTGLLAVVSIVRLKVVWPCLVMVIVTSDGLSTSEMLKLPSEFVVVVLAVDGALLLLLL